VLTPLVEVQQTRQESGPDLLPESEPDVASNSGGVLWYDVTSTLQMRVETMESTNRSRGGVASTSPSTTGRLQVQTDAEFLGQMGYENKKQNRLAISYNGRSVGHVGLARFPNK
jgi:hypothetical protein